MWRVGGGEFPPLASSVPRSRHLVRDVAGHLSPAAQDAAELVVNELTTNSVVHAATGFELFVAADDRSVEVVVSDRSGGPQPAARPPAISGHGLLLVGLLSTRWSATPDIRGGTRIWARVDVDDVPAN
jgi:two-component sensor histidine kinase